MRIEDSYPRRVSDPAAEGIPEYAVDDSSANDDADSFQLADGYDPAALPGDREQGELATDDFGTTAEEQLHGEDLAGRLAREEPEVTTAEVPGDRLSEADAGPVDPHLDSQVSMYDRPGLDPLSETRVGRLVETDAGAHPDDEVDAIAFDLGPAGGAPNAEEAAMHEIPQQEPQ
jgi:Family of unknown function (DUF5709)